MKLLRILLPVLIGVSPAVAWAQAPPVDLIVNGNIVSSANPLPVLCVSGCSGVLPTGAATAANQVTQITAEQAIQATIGTTTGAAVTTDANGTLQQYLRGLVKQWISGTLVLGPGSNIIGKTGIDQTTPGTTNAVVAGFFSDRQTSTPTIQAAAYSANNCVGGFNSVTFQGTGPINALDDVRLISQGGGTETLTVYVFDQNPTGSTCTDKSTFTLATADTAKLLMAPFALTLAAQQGATQSFASNPNLGRHPKAGTTTLWYALVAGGTFTPATTSDLIVGFQVVQSRQ